MKKALLKIVKIFGVAVLGLLLLLVLSGGVLHIPSVQRLIAEKASGWASSYLNLEVSIRRLDFNLLKREVDIYGFQVLDSRQNPMVTASQGSVVLKNYDFTSPALSSAILIRPEINIRRYDGDSMSDFKRVLRIFSSRPKKDTSLRKAFIIEHLSVEDGTFYYDAEDEPQKSGNQVDFKHIALSGVYADASDFYTRNGKVLVKMKHLECEEGNGFSLHDFSSWIYVDKGKLAFVKTQIETPSSMLKLDLSLGAEDWKKYRDFLENVEIKARLRSSELDLGDLSFFVQGVRGMDQKVLVKADISGKFSSMKVTGLGIDYGNSTGISGDFEFRGLPKLEDMTAVLDVKDMHLSVRDLDGFTLPGGEPLRLPEVIHSMDFVRLKGKLSGGLNRFSSNIDIETGMGNISLETRISDTIAGSFRGMTGKLEATDVAIGHILNEKLLQDLDLGLKFTLIGDSYSDMRFLVSGQVDKMQIGKNFLQPIRFSMERDKKVLLADLKCSDPGLDFNLDGVYCWEGMTWSEVDLNLKNLDLSPLRIMGDTGICALRSWIHVDHRGNDEKTVEGDLLLKDIRLVRLGQSMSMDSLYVRISNQDSVLKQIHLRSMLADLDYTGGPLSKIGSVVISAISSYFPDAERYLAGNRRQEMGSGKKKGKKSKVRKLDVRKDTHDFDLSLSIRNLDTILPLFVKGLEVPLGMEINARYDKISNGLEVFAKYPYLQKGRLASMNGSISFLAQPERVDFDLNMEKFYLSDSVRMNHFHLGLQCRDTNTVAYHMGWGYKEGVKEQTSNANITGVLNVLPEAALQFNVGESSLEVSGVTWMSYDGGSLFYSGDSLVLHDFGMYAADLSGGIRLEGEVSKQENSVLRADFNRFSLTYLDFLLEKSGMNIQAALDGYAEIHDFYNRFVFDADLALENLQINGHDYGRAVLSSNFSRKDAVQARFEVCKDSLERNLFLEGTYFPLQNHKVDFKGRVDAFDMSFLQGFLSGIMKDMQGELYGEIGCSGNFKNLNLMAEVEARNLTATIPVIDTRYRFERFPITLNSKKIVFEPTVFHDVVYQTEGSFSGSIEHANFKDMQVGLNVNFDNLLAFNAKKSMTLPFWGTVFASGRLGIKGPTSNIRMTLSAQVQENSDLSFDFSAPGGSGGASFINFRKPEIKDSGLSLDRLYTERNTVQGKKKDGGLSMELNLDVTPGLSVSLGIKNPAMSGNLFARGSGLLRLSMGKGSPQLFGTYRISGGEFDFSMVDLINKRFTLEEGGTLSWIGPMTDARVNIRADYQTKASLYPVLSSLSMSEEDARQYRQSVNVNSIIVLSGNLMSPEIGFEIDLANVDDDTRDKFFAVVKKDDEDEMLRQTFSLLMFNTFMSVEGGTSGVGNSALASSSDLLFSQFNNFISKFTTDFNIGVNYKPRDQVSNSEFQVMMSGQLFDDRLMINGNIGVSENRAGATANAGASTVVGDVDIEWKFTEELRLRGFNHSNYQDLTKPANSYTQGVGIVFKRDFDNLKEFLYGSNPKTKEERKAERKRNKEIRKARRNNRLRR